MNHLIRAAVVVAVLGGSVGCTSDRFHSLMRVKPVPLTDFLPGKERLERRADTFVFHYTWADTNAVYAADFKNVYIAPFEVSALRQGNGYDRLRDCVVGLDDAITDLADYGRKAFVQAFAKREKETKLKVVEDPSLPDTMQVELAITAFAPTRAEIEIVGTVGSFVCPVPGVDFVADYLAAGSIAVECRVRDMDTNEVVAMFADTEGDPDAFLQFAKFTYTSSAKINLKRIAQNTVRCCLAEDEKDLRRAFPYGFLIMPGDAKLDD